MSTTNSWDTTSDSLEGALAEAQSDMVAIATEYVAGRAEDIYLYVVVEPGLTYFNVFFRIGGRIYSKHKLNDSVDGPPIHDVSPGRQKQMSSIAFEALVELKKAARQFERPMPTEMRMHYSVTTGSMTSEFRYNKVLPEASDRWVTDIFDEWQAEVSASNEASPTSRAPAPPSTWKEALLEAQRSMMRVARDYVSGQADDILVYALASAECPFFDVFYRIGSRFYGTGEVSDAVFDGVAHRGVTYDVVRPHQQFVIETGLSAVGDLVDAAPHFGVPLPLEMRLEYSLADRQMTQSFRNRDLAADLEVRSPEQIATAWRFDLGSPNPSA